MNDNSEGGVAAALKSAGWYPGRSVDISALENIGVEIFPAARTVLQEFYGLHIGTCGPGKECATSDIRLDPLLAAHVIEDFPKYEKGLRVKLFPLGDVHRSHGFVVIDEMGRTYLMDDELVPFARSFEDALKKFVKGLLPDQA
ncbi:MAG: SUKH-3 domain-containing protein [Planctomycetaceae bacterium]